MEEHPMEKPKSKIGIIIAIVLVVLCCCVIILAAIGVVAYEFYKQMPSVPDVPFGPPTATPVVVVTRPPTVEVPTDTLETLKTTIVPENDPRELACRLEGKCNIPETMDQVKIDGTINQHMEMDHFSSLFLRNGIRRSSSAVSMGQC